MDEIEKRLKREAASTAKIDEDRNRLIAEGSYPEKFSFPIAMQFEVTSKCNLRCKHCYNRSGNSNVADTVTGDDWINFSKKLVEKGGLFETTFSGGEPLLLGDKLFEIMDVLYKDGTIFNLISNGYLFDKKILDKLKKYRFYWIQISLDSCNSKSHDEFRGVKGSWERATKAAYRIALSGIPLRIASTVTPSELENLEKMVQTAINLGASYLVIGEVMPSGRAFDNEEIFLSREQLNQFYLTTDEIIKRYKNQLTILVSSTTRTQLNYSSSEKLDGAVVRPNGDVRLDCTCPFVIGNILRDDVEEIWAKYFNCWQNPLVKKFIESCDPISGKNSFAENYNGEDIYL
ncbi:MAG: radical SAM protein [Selenomonadaceae bacterium]|nr:radical SAM protein [Selenomonadaceae bacterium]